MSEIIQALREIVGDAAVLTGEDTAGYTTGARYGAGRALCVVRPPSVAETPLVVAHCAAEGVQIIPQRANTGLVGASTPDDSGTQVLLSLTRLRSRCSIDVGNRTVNADAGFRLHEVNDKLEPRGLWLPIDLAADPTVGGMVACNTGGTRLIRYGDIRHNLLAVEAVLFDPPGEVVCFGNALRKNNTGFDLKQLFVGASRACGVVTRATFEVSRLPVQTATALVVPASEESVSTLLRLVEAEVGDFLSAFEGLSWRAIQAATDHVRTLRNPLADEPASGFTVLIEVASCAARSVIDLEQVLMGFLEDRLSNGEITDAALGRGHDLWQLRHSRSDGARALGRVVGFDVSVGRDDIMRFRRAASALVNGRIPHLEVVDFGQVGYGGLHFNLVWPHDCPQPWNQQVVNRVRGDIYQLTVEEFSGSFSAEHGVGPHNLGYYEKYTGTAHLRLAGRLQRTIDPTRVGGGVNYGGKNVWREL